MDEPYPGIREVWNLVVGIAQRRLEVRTDIQLTRREIGVPYADASGSRGQRKALLAFAQRDFRSRPLGRVAHDAQNSVAVVGDQPRFKMSRFTRDIERVLHDHR